MENENKPKGDSTRKPHEEQRTRLLEYQHFDLKKIKLEKKGADISHHEAGSDAGLITKIGETIPHPDLKKTMELLKPIMARRLGLLEGTDTAKLIAKGDLDNYKIASDKEREIINRCNVNGITFGGSGDKYWVMITGSVLTPESGSFGLAVPKITFGTDTLGYEEEAENICEEIKKEVFAYRFQNKKQQLDLVFEAEKIEEEEASANTNASKEKPKKSVKKEAKKPLFKDQIEDGIDQPQQGNKTPELI
jgi:ribosomal protein L29